MAPKHLKSLRFPCNVSDRQRHSKRGRVVLMKSRMIRTLDDQHRRQQRLALIAGLEAQGTSLLSAAPDDSLKTRTRLALLDLDNVVNWLTQDVVELDPELLQVIDTTIDVATRHMAIVAHALDASLTLSRVPLHSWQAESTRE